MVSDKPVKLTKKDIELLSTYGCMVVRPEDEKNKEDAKEEEHGTGDGVHP
ncbi:MAG: hypothetical protein ACI3X3_06965 [Acidaminococcus sp.]